MIEAVQRNMGAEHYIFALRPLGLKGDIGGVQARRTLARLIAVECAPATTNQAVGLERA